jgi:glycosyltransferase involved in cell wall biosynthesis
LKILFLSTHNLSTNPRLVKEIELALQLSYSVSVLCFEFDNWSKPLNEEIKKRLVTKINYQSMPGSRAPLLPWLISSLFFSLSKIGLVFFPGNEYLLSLRSNKRSWLLQLALKKLKEKFDLVVAHNPGSFYPAMIFAKKNKIPFGIDLEDYHAGESNDEKVNTIYRKLNKATLPHAAYITGASPLILEHSEADLSVTLKNKQVISNYFSSMEFIIPVNSISEKLTLVWFSQNISFHRGLEELIPFMKNNDQIELHLFGNCDESFREQWLFDCSNIQLHASLPQSELHQQLAHYDVGLAIEPGKDINNEFALSNKILAYFQSGLYILASNTKAQRRFIIEHPEHGMLTSLSPDDLMHTFQHLTDQKQSLRALAKGRFGKAAKFNWENESGKLAEIWKEMRH